MYRYSHSEDIPPLMLDIRLLYVAKQMDTVVSLTSSNGSH